MTMAFLLKQIESANIAEDMDQYELADIGQTAHKGLEKDVTSRANWLAELKEIRTFVSSEKKDEKSYPWPNASNINYPLLLTAAMQFNANAYPALINSRELIKVNIHGTDNEAKEARARRVAKHMNYQFLEEMDGWDSDMDRMTSTLPIDGMAFKKIYFDPVAEKNVSELIQPEDLIVNDSTKDLRTCPRISHVFALYPFEVVERQQMGRYLDIAIDYENEEEQEAEDFVEQHTLLDLDDDGYPEPYIVTFHKKSSKVVRIQANFTADSIFYQGNDLTRIEPMQFFVAYTCFPDPAGGFYSRGFGQLLRPLMDSIDSILNQLIDAGHLSNTGGGFLGRNMRVEGGAMTFTPGEWKKVDVGGAAMKDSILPLPVRDPSPVLFQLLGLLIDAGKDISSTQNIMSGDVSGNMPASTAMALIERGMKVYNAIFKRIWRGMKEEAELVFLLNRKHLLEEDYAKIVDDENAKVQTDYDWDQRDIGPAADPKMSTSALKAMRAQGLLALAGQPDVNSRAIKEEYISSLGYENADRFIADKAAMDEQTQIQKALSEEMKRENDLKNQEMAIKMKAYELDMAELQMKIRSAGIKDIETASKVMKNVNDADESPGDNIANVIEAAAATKAVQNG